MIAPFKTQKEVQKILKERGLAPTKKLGQNFLVDRNMALKILKALNLKPHDRVLEIGPGLGNLTDLLQPQVQEVVAIEFDQGLARFLNEEISQKNISNLKLIQEDALRVNWSQVFLRKSFKVIGNFPYYITGPLLIKLLDHKKFLETAVVMVQKEVGEKLFAKPGSKDYNRLSVLFNLWAEVSKVASVPANCFFPKPDVESIVLKIVFLKEARFHLRNELGFGDILNAAFGKRRKMISNSLKDLFRYGRVLDSGEIEMVLREAEISPRIRPETLSAEQFVRLANSIEEKL